MKNEEINQQNHLYPAAHCLRGLNWYQIFAWTMHHSPVLLYTNHIRFTVMDIHKTLIKMVNSKKLRVSSKGTCFNLICFVVCIHDNDNNSYIL